MAPEAFGEFLNPDFRFLAGVAVLVVAASIGYAATPRRGIVPPLCAEAPAIDGKLDDGCWKTAAVTGGFSQFALPGKLHPEQTEVRACYDEDHLYLALKCEVAEMDKFRARMDEAKGAFRYSRGGVFELFLDVNRDRKTFQQYMLHANGTALITIDANDLLRALNDEYLRRKAVVTETGFVIEAAIPFAMLHLHPDAATTWGFNLNRVHDLYDERFDRNGFYSSWNSTAGEGFQTPEKFGDLVLEADFSPFYWNVALDHEPQPGDEEIAARVVNETGRDFSGSIVLQVGKARHEAKLAIKADAGVSIRFKHRVTIADSGARVRIGLADDDGRVRYMGGTQKEDRTPGDDREPPVPSGAERRAGLIVFRRPYTQPVLYKAVPRHDEATSQLAMVACRGEFEPITFSVYALRPIDALKVSAGDLSGPGEAKVPAEAIDVRRVAWQSDWSNPKSFEAKEHLLRHFDSLRLAEGMAQRFWVTVRVPEDAPAGRYTGTITLTADDVETPIRLHLAVPPFDLSEADGMGYFMYYPGLKHESVSNEAFLRKTVEDMRDHGMTTFTIYLWVAKKDAETGQTTIDVDEQVSETLGVTYARMMDILGEGGLGRTAPLLDVHSMNYDPDVIVGLDRICRERGWPEVLFYIEDEIDYPERIKRARKILEDIRQRSPDIRTTTALGKKGATALGHMYDVWIGCSTPEMIEMCNAKGKAPWTYSCRAVYEVSPAFERAFFGRFAWKLGLRGVSLWSYAEDSSFSDRFGRKQTYADFETFPMDWRHRYGHVVFEKDEIVPTVTWEAVREGIDDYRYMLTLKKEAEAALEGDDETAHKAARAGLRLLDEIAERTPVLSDDKKYGRAWRELGDMDADRTAVINAIMAIRGGWKKAP
ncbi:MAG: hypothetical protein CMJ18_16395 [Phycisphaeraceae bacterium]|nr:hypothetical protein [Phycisphaeraceae bacterium]